MTTELKTLYDEKGKTWAKMQDVARRLKGDAEKGIAGVNLTADEEKQFDGWDGELKSITDKIRRIERAEELETELNTTKLKATPGNGASSEELVEAQIRERDLTYRKGLSRGVDKLDEKERKLFNSMEIETRAFEKFLRSEELSDVEQHALSYLKKNASKANQGVQRAQSTTGSAGGFTIPQGFLAEIDQQLKLVSPFFEQGLFGPTGIAKSIFSFIPTETGNDLPFPTNNDTGNTGELLGENTDAFAAAVDAVLAQVTFKAYKFSSKPMKVSNELLADSAVDLPAFLAELLGTRIGRVGNTYMTTGTGTAQPQGIVTGAVAGKTSAASGAITFPEIIDLVHSVDAAYRKSPSCRFMLHDLILAYLKKQTIGSATNDSRPLWQPGYTQGAPDTIDGFQYLINNDMASTLVTTNISMLFGDMSKFGIRQVRNMVFRRLDERFADADQTAWVLFIRMDSRYKNVNAIKKLTQV